MASSNQKFIARNRAPRVQISYDVEMYGAHKGVQLPLVIGVLADLTGNPKEPLPQIADRRFVEMDVDCFEHRIRYFRPRVAFSVPNTLTGEGEMEVDLAFESMDDFRPDAIAANVAPLSGVLRTRQLIFSLRSAIDRSEDAEKFIAEIVNKPSRFKIDDLNASDSDFLKRVREAFGPRTEQAMEALKAAIAAVAEQADRAPHFVTTDVTRTLQAFLDDVDGKLTQQVNLILHHPDFQSLEGCWRGLHYLVQNTESDATLKVRVLNISQKELGKTLKKYSGSAWDQSPIFKMLYEDEFGFLGGQPYSCVIGDYYFDHNMENVQLLGSLAQIGSAMHAPFIVGASPALLNMDNWMELPNQRDISAIFSSPEHAPWRSLRESEESKYIALALPRFLARLPYGDRTDPVEAFHFEEQVEKGLGSANSFVWCNSAYGMGVCIARSFKYYGWPARIRGIESGGLLEDLPVYTFPTDAGGVETLSPTEVAITDRREAELAKSGLMPLVHRKNASEAAFIGANSLQEPAAYDDPDITANAALTARLPYLLACCRFAHYLKCIARDRVGVNLDRPTLENLLNDWISQFVDPEPGMSSEVNKARRPLADAQVVLDEVEGRPGLYTAKLYIRPHFQLEGLTVSNRLILQLEHAA